MRRKNEILTTREYHAVLVAALFAVGRREEAAEFVEHGIRSDRLPRRLFEELFLHLSLLLGFPSMLDGLARLREISSVDTKHRRGIQESEKSVKNRGEKTFARIYGKTTDRLIANLGALHESVPSVIVRDAYGRIISRRGMSLGEREIVNVVVLSIQKLDRQLFSHLRGALRAGVRPATLRSAIILGSRKAGTIPRTALKMLSVLTPSGQRHR